MFAAIKDRVGDALHALFCRQEAADVVIVYLAKPNTHVMAVYQCDYLVATYTIGNVELLQKEFRKRNGEMRHFLWKLTAKHPIMIVEAETPRNLSDLLVDGVPAL